MHAVSFSTGADAPAPVDFPLSLRADGLVRILRTANACGWRSAGIRRRGSLAGDVAGFPNLILAHGGAGRVWFLFIRQGAGPLPIDVQAWGETLIRAGAVWRLVNLPDDLDQLCVDLADSVRPT